MMGSKETDRVFPYPSCDVSTNDVNVGVNYPTQQQSQISDTRQLAQTTESGSCMNAGNGTVVS